MTRTALILAASASLGACTTLSGCDKPKASPPSASGTGRHMSLEQARMLSTEPFDGKTRWYASMVYGGGREVILISDPSSPGGEERRLLRLKQDGGYVVTRIRTMCAQGSYVVRDARQSNSDAGAPHGAANGDAGLDIRIDLMAICGRTAKLPTFEGTASTAAAKARNMTQGLSSEADRASGNVPLALKSGENPPKAVVIREP